MRARTAALFAAVAVAAAAAGAAWHLWRSAAPGGAGAAIERLHAARFPDLQGQPQAMGQWRGRVMVVNFWATWCAPCREEIPGFVRLQQRYGARGLQFVGIAIDQPAKVAEFAKEFAINYPVLIGSYDTLELLREAGNQAGVLPYTLVIDRAGAVVSRHPGGLKEDRLEGLIGPLM